MSKPFSSLLRQIHFWGAIICLLPVLVMTVSGVLLLLKKDIEWIQPSSAASSVRVPTVNFDQVLHQLRSQPELEIDSWQDVQRLDVRPGKGIVKARSHNRWEVQLNLGTGEILKLAYRRSDIIESIHDGSFFHRYAKLGLFLPSALLLFVLSLTGAFLFGQRLILKNRKRQRLILLKKSADENNHSSFLETNLQSKVGT